jgi:hypothetical protein
LSTKTKHGILLLRLASSLCALLTKRGLRHVWPSVGRYKLEYSHSSRETEIPRRDAALIMLHAVCGYGLSGGRRRLVCGTIAHRLEVGVSSRLEDSEAQKPIGVVQGVTQGLPQSWYGL